MQLAAFIKNMRYCFKTQWETFCKGTSCMKSDELLVYVICATLREQLKLSAQFVDGTENKPQFIKVGSDPKGDKS